MAREISVGDLSARSGLPVSALHFYERRGLIRSRRTAGNQRRYEREVLRRLGVIQAAQALGIPLAEVARALATLPDGRTPTRADWESIAAGWAAALDRRIAGLLRLRENLAGCIGCGCLSIDRCAMFNADDHLGRQETGPALLMKGG